MHRDPPEPEVAATTASPSQVLCFLVCGALLSLFERKCWKKLRMGGYHCTFQYVVVPVLITPAGSVV